MKVKFLPMNVEHEINQGESVLELAKRQGVFVKSLCGGMPSCAECRIKIVEGEHNVLGPGFKEKALIGSAYFIDHSRLSCQVKCMGDITVDLTEQIEKQNAQPVSKKARAPIKRVPRGAPGSGGANKGQNQFKPPSSMSKNNEKQSENDDDNGDD
jgi:2Fe-2S ferredoxin